MTHSEFDHILRSIITLSPEQMQQLRRELDRKVASAAAQGGPPPLVVAASPD